MIRPKKSFVSGAELRLKHNERGSFEGHNELFLVDIGFIRGRGPVTIYLFGITMI